AAIALPRMWSAAAAAMTAGQGMVTQTHGAETVLPRGAGWLHGRRWPLVWQTLTAVLLVLGLTYVLLGTPARLSQRMVGWRPPFGTLNGMDYMVQGSYTWPDDSHRIELGPDHE